MKYRLSIWLLFILSSIYSTDIYATKKILTKTTTETSDPLGDGVLRILAIGNSFSEDGLENYLYDLAKNANKKIVIGNLYIGGAPLTLHITNAEHNKTAYSYRKIDLAGNKVVTKNTSILTALNDDNWDYVSFQQASPLSGLLESYSPYLDQLINYVSDHIKTKTTKYIFHQTWAYAQNSTHTGFVNYNCNQLEMYNAIMSASKAIYKNKDYHFSKLVPSGTAIQNMRTTYVGDHLNRDGYHLDLNYGRFTAACTWYETLFGLNVTKNDFVPKNISEKLAALSKTAAHKAVLKPFKITVLKDFAVDDNK